MIENNNIDLLLVEDNFSDAELILRALKKINFPGQIFVVRDGEEALDFIYAKGKFYDKVSIKPPKLILLDLKLPKVDGLEVLKILKEDPAKNSIPIVMLTSSNEERDIVESYKLGANSYIVKPINSEKFINTVHQVGSYWLFLNQPNN